MTEKRRECDHFGEVGYKSHTTPCDKLLERVGVEEQIFDRLDSIEEQLKQMHEMMQVWNNTKGFVATIRNAGGVILWIVGIGAAVTVLVEGTKHWLTGK